MPEPVLAEEGEAHDARGLNEAIAGRHVQADVPPAGIDDALPEDSTHLCEGALVLQDPTARRSEGFFPAVSDRVKHVIELPFFAGGLRGRNLTFSPTMPVSFPTNFL